MADVDTLTKPFDPSPGGYYILTPEHMVVEVSLMEWAIWFEGKPGRGDYIKHRRVAHTKLKHCDVSTVFLGMDHNFGSGRPLLFETMTFPKKVNGKIDFDKQEMDRYSTYGEAVVGHEEMVNRWKDYKPKPKKRSS